MPRLEGMSARLYPDRPLFCGTHHAPLNAGYEGGARKEAQKLNAAAVSGCGGGVRSGRIAHHRVLIKIGPSRGLVGVLD